MAKSFSRLRTRHLGFLTLVLALLHLACGNGHGDATMGETTATDEETPTTPSETTTTDVSDGNSGTGTNTLSSTGSTGTMTTETTGTTTTGTTTTGTTTTETTTQTTGTTTSDTETATSSDDGGATVECGGTIYQCGDGIDNDQDGKIDGNDDECVSACDNDEASFATGIPGDNKDCKQDCFFDGDSGSGNDDCEWNLRCDPANPGEGSQCEFSGGPSCDHQDPPSTTCIDFCLPFVPNGCDCFGCCEVHTDDGMVTVFLGSGGDCSVDNLDACNSCTMNSDCSNPCEPEACEECLGDVEVPVDCGDNETDDTTGTSEDGCSNGQTTCATQDECPSAYYCLHGCCYPVPG